MGNCTSQEKQALDFMKQCDKDDKFMFGDNCMSVDDFKNEFYIDLDENNLKEKLKQKNKFFESVKNCRKDQGIVNPYSKNFDCISRDDLRLFFQNKEFLEQKNACTGYFIDDTCHPKEKIIIEPFENKSNFYLFILLVLLLYYIF